MTFQDLKEMSPNSIFAFGEVIDNSTGINITGSGEMLRWVAVRGGIHDWAIYCHFADKTKEWIKDYGDKIFRESHIKKLVPCTDEAFKMYRY